MVLLQSLIFGKEEIKPDEPLSLPELMELSTELALNLCWKHWWLFMAMSGFITVSPLQSPCPPGWRRCGNEHHFSPPPPWPSLCSLQQINQVPGAGDWPGLPWRHLAQLRQLDTNGESSQHLVARKNFHFKNEFIFENRPSHVEYQLAISGVWTKAETGTCDNLTTEGKN